MKFLNIMQIDKSEDFEQSAFDFGSEYAESAFQMVHQAPLEHHVFHWLETNVEETELMDFKYFELTKENLQRFHKVCGQANAEKTGSHPAPWKYMQIPDENKYRYYMEEYSKDYGKFYYDSVYNYQMILGVILNIFDFENKRLIVKVT